MSLFLEFDMISSVYIDNKKKCISVLTIGPTQGLDDDTLTAEAKNSILIFQDKNFKQKNFV